MKQFILLFALVWPAFAGAPTAIAIHNARIVPVSGPPIEHGAIVVRDGLIQAVGANVNIPSDAWIIEGEGLTVYPGLIDAMSTIGIPEASPTGAGAASRPATPATPAAATPSNPPARGPEDRPNTTSWLRAADLIKTTDPRIETVRSNGFTTSVTFPMHGIFAGQGAVIDLSGDRPGQMVVAEPVGQYMTLSSSGFGGGFPGSLMGTIAYIRQVYLDCAHYQKAREAMPRILRASSARTTTARLKAFWRPPAFCFQPPAAWMSIACCAWPPIWASPPSCMEFPKVIIPPTC